MPIQSYEELQLKLCAFQQLQNQTKEVTVAPNETWRLITGCKLRPRLTLSPDKLKYQVECCCVVRGFSQTIVGVVYVSMNHLLEPGIRIYLFSEDREIPVRW